MLLYIFAGWLLCGVITAVLFFLADLDPQPRAASGHYGLFLLLGPLTLLFLIGERLVMGKPAEHGQGCECCRKPEK